MKKNKLLWPIISVLTVVLLGVFFFLPLPYFVESPGPVVNLSTFVTVENTKDEQSGSFNITTVREREATPFFLLMAKFTSFNEIYSKQEVLGDATTAEYNQMNAYFMTSSQNAAKVEALKLANKEYQMTFKGVYVMSINEKSDFIHHISIGDTVTAVDGHTFESSADMIKYIRGLKVGQEVKVTFISNGQEKEATGKLMQLPESNYPGIGISLVDNTQITSDTNITFNSGGIGGPSGGLMLTLETYVQLTNNDLRKGRMIAGTGTMDFEGNVGRIGGIDKKVVSASRQGAVLFFAPDDEITPEMKKANPNIKSNYQEALAAAKKINTNMKIVPVRTVQDAIDYLKQNN
ncbi:MAG: PDZ domain-containing protein [Streptococcaceae bacterium]|jgi:PDZ domain-containing protein|nr:PDZ domain-containing protein [Streptococcaceae bacterium]